MLMAIEERGRDTRDASHVSAQCGECSDPTPSTRGRFRVVIAGAGPAGIEAALALQRIAGDRVITTIVAPERFVHLPPTALSPFALGNRYRLPLDGLAGADLRQGRLISVDATSREVSVSGDETLTYDALLVAVGGNQMSPYPRALAFGAPGTEERMHGLIQDIEDGYVKRVAFVVPPGASWPLPVYELALMTAARAFDMCVSVELTLVTPEPSPLAIFGEEVSQDVAQMLATAGIVVRGRANTEMRRHNGLELYPTGERLDVDRVVTVPILSGPAIDGLPHDEAGFLRVDTHGRVAGATGVYAAGDATDFEIKQGGIACQQADAAAEAIAAEAGVAIEPTPFTAVLSGLLLTEHDTRWMQRSLGQESVAKGEEWPRTKFAGREISRLLRDVPVHAR
jgi:sulfide:quinone oxidoreductase